jgi:polysaccharide pyruvyl transferase WcaK-like protein
MTHAGKYGVAGASDAPYSAYLENLVTIVRWFLARDYDVRLLGGDVEDIDAWQAFRALFREHLLVCDEERIIVEPICSVEGLLSQIVATDIVIATRFHNVLLALLCNRPVISISFHHKCESLMSAMGLSQYCLDVNDFKANRLIEKFCDLETNSDEVKALITDKAREFRKALDQQYKIIFEDMLLP